MPGKEHYRNKVQQPTQGNTYKKMFPFIRGYLFQYKKIKVIISSPYFTTSSSDVVAKQTGVKELTLATSTNAFDQVKDYFSLFDYDIDHLIAVLK